HVANGHLENLVAAHAHGVGFAGDGVGTGGDSAAAGFDDEHAFDVAAAAQGDAEDAGALGGRFEDDRAGAVAEQDAGAAVFPVDETRQGLAGDKQDTAGGATLDELAANGEAVDEATARRVDVEGAGADAAELLL